MYYAKNWGNNMENKITFNQLVEKLSKTTGCSISTSEAFVRDFFQFISTQLEIKNKITIKGFGTFSVIDEDIDIVKYEPDKDISDAINLPFSCFDIIEIAQDVTDDIFAENPITNETETIESINLEEDIISPNILKENTIDEEKIYPNNDNIENTVTENEIVETISELKNEDMPSIDNNSINTDEQDEEEAEPEKARKNKKTILYVIITLIIGVAIGYYLGNIYPIKIYIGLNSHELLHDTIIDTTTILFEQDTISRDTVKLLEDVSDINIVKDTISTNRFLTTMARKHYGEMYFWVYIYEENKNILKNPNHIKPGTVVIIPPASKYGFDKNDIESVEKAKSKAMEIYSRYQ